MTKHITLFILGFIALDCVAFAEKINVYFGTGGGEAKGIYRAKFDSEKGKLHSPSLAAKLERPGFLAWSPDKSKLYTTAGIKDEAAVVGYHVLKDGSLKKFTSSLIQDGPAAHIAVHPSGKFLLTAQYRGGSTAFFPIHSDGKLGDVTVIKHTGGAKTSKRQASPHPHWCGFSPDGRFAFVPDLGTNQIHIYKVSADQTSISEHTKALSVEGGGPRHMRFSAEGKFIYLLNELKLSVTTFAYDSEKGTANRLTTTPALTDGIKSMEAFNSAAEILIHPNGQFVWSSNRGNDSITCYKANPRNGVLSVSEIEPIRGSWPRNINIDPTSNWILAAGAHSNTISVFKIDQTTGKLTFQTRGIINVPSPMYIIFGK